MRELNATGLINEGIDTILTKSIDTTQALDANSLTYLIAGIIFIIILIFGLKVMLK